MNSPDLINKIIGYRSWKFNGTGLTGMHYIVPPWEGGVNTAVCSSIWTPVDDHMFKDHHGRDHGKAPDPDCRCGLYGLHELPDPDQDAFFIDMGYGHNEIYGAIRAWGQMEVYDRGFRAEFAEIIAFGFVPKIVESYNNTRKIVISGKYGNVPMVSIKQLQTLAECYGEPIPEALRPERPLYPGQPLRTLGGVISLVPTPSNSNISASQSLQIQNRIEKHNQEVDDAE